MYMRNKSGPTVPAGTVVPNSSRDSTLFCCVTVELTRTRCSPLAFLLYLEQSVSWVPILVQEQHHMLLCRVPNDTSTWPPFWICSWPMEDWAVTCVPDPWEATVNTGHSVAFMLVDEMIREQTVLGAPRCPDLRRVREPIAQPRFQALWSPVPVAALIGSGGRAGSMESPASLDLRRKGETVHRIGGPGRSFPI